MTEYSTNLMLLFNEYFQANAFVTQIGKARRVKSLSRYPRQTRKNQVRWGGKSRGGPPALSCAGAKVSGNETYGANASRRLRKRIRCRSLGTITAAKSRKIVLWKKKRAVSFLATSALWPSFFACATTSIRFHSPQVRATFWRVRVLLLYSYIYS